MASISSLENFLPNLRCYSRALTGNPEIADDLVEKCLHTAIKNFEPAPQNGVRIWVFSLLHDVLIREAQSDRRLRKPTTLPQGSASDARVADGREPGLQLAFHALGFAQKAVLFLMAVEDFSDQEAAIITRMTVANVRKALRDALDQLSALSLVFLALRREGENE